MNARFLLMKSSLVFLLAVSLASTLAASAQDSGGAPPPGPSPQQRQRGGRGGFGGMMGGRGIIGTVTAVADDHYVIKTDSGESRTVSFSVNTRILKQPAQPPGQRPAEGGERPMPQPIKPADIKIGDAIVANGEPDGTGNAIGAVLIVQLDPDRARQMREMQANFGKTWLMGKVVSVRETQITLQSPVDNAPHTFTADENTSFRKRRDFITLADVQVGDNVRVDGAVKQGIFVATGVNVMAMPPANGGPQPMRDKPPQ